MNFTPSEREVIVPLLDVESTKLLKDEYGITSITFYHGDRAKVPATIRARVKAIVNTNPWLAGRLVQNKRHKNLQLVYPQAPVSDDIIERLFHPDPSQVRIGSEMRYEELTKAAKSAVVKKGNKLINNPDLVTRITIVPDIDCREDGFALIFSVSHIAADGDTYYQVLNSIFTTGPIEPLRPTRNQEASNKVPEAQGRKEYSYFFSIPFILNILKGLLFGKKVICYAFYVDPDKIKIVKDEIIANTTDSVDFVSTNDILTSSFAKTIRARLCIMLINFRNRIEGISNKDAGNYEGGLLFDDEVYARPSSIRKTLQNGPPFLTTAKPLPGFWEGMWCSLCLITNWSTFAGDFVLDGCEQRLHLPLYAPEMQPADIAIVFKPKPDKLAVMYFAKTVSRDDLLSRCELGEPVSTKMFQ